MGRRRPCCVPITDQADGTMIVYGNFCVRYTVGADDDQKMEPHTAFTQNPPTRMTRHRSDILNALNNSAASIHHRCALSEDVTPNFRVLAVSPPDTDSAYGPLLESLFMVLLNSFQDHGNQYTKWRTKASLLLAASMREKLKLPHAMERSEQRMVIITRSAESQHLSKSVPLHTLSEDDVP